MSKQKKRVYAFMAQKNTRLYKAPKHPKKSKGSGGFVWPKILLAGAAVIAVSLILLIAVQAAKSEPAVKDNIIPAESAVPSATPMPTATPIPTATPVPVVTPLPPVEPMNPDEGFNQAALAALDAYAEAQPGHVAVWLYDINSGEEFYHYDGGFYCASTLKAPYALWLCQQDEAGVIDLDTPLEFGTGWELIYDLISRSSNGAARVLGQTWPGDATTGFNEFLRQIGFDSPDGCEVSPESIKGWVTARDGGRAMQAVYSYFQTGSENAKKLEEAFLAANHDILWLPGKAAKKYGSWDKAFHDMAIVYGEKPYIISVFTDWGDPEISFPEEAVAMMHEIGRLAANAVGVPGEE